MNCPICGSELKTYSYTDDIQGAWIVVESGSDCTVCDYSSFDSYGQYITTFGNNYFEYYWNTPAEERDKIEKEIADKLSTARPRFTYSKVRYYKVDNDTIPF